MLLSTSLPIDERDESFWLERGNGVVLPWATLDTNTVTYTETDPGAGDLSLVADADNPLTVTGLVRVVALRPGRSTNRSTLVPERWSLRRRSFAKTIW